MTKHAIPLQGFAYKQGDELEVYLSIDGRFVKMTGTVKDAQRNFGRWTRMRRKRSFDAESAWAEREDAG